ncbi:MAG: GDYXXLXY domain-containing protein [Mariprofundaceae bacterium]|nr:GDYXXLXY domain-containing protein [Mariprofundaceae bacterium]
MSRDMSQKLSLTLRMGIVVVMLTLVLFGMIARKQWTLATGTPVVLETQPVDPRSLFRGDYVRLNYTINTLDSAGYPALSTVKRGDTVYVTLVPGEPYWQPKTVSTECPNDASSVVLKGRVDRVNRRWNRETRQYEVSHNVRVKFGVEHYFVPEGTGRAIERPVGGEKVSIEVAVDRFGNAGIRAVLINGVPRYIETLF